MPKQMTLISEIKEFVSIYYCDCTNLYIAVIKSNIEYDNGEIVLTDEALYCCKSISDIKEMLFTFNKDHCLEYKEEIENIYK